jgi:hypothetical protein
MPAYFSEVEMEEAEADALARAVDERVLAIPEGCDPARLFGVRLRQQHADGFVLVPFWSGVAREVPAWLVPPDGCDAIAIESGGWAAPMDDMVGDGTVMRPSQHPEAQRMHSTALVYGRGVDVTVLRVGDEPPRVMRGGVGVVPDLLRACWARRRSHVA